MASDPENLSLVPWKYNNPNVEYSNMEVLRLPLSGYSVCLRQDIHIDIDATQNTAYKVWDGSFLLAKHLENTDYFPPGYFSHKQCVELGAGCGLVGMAAWLLGAKVGVTDLQECLHHTEKCVRMNVESLQPGGSGDRRHTDHLKHHAEGTNATEDGTTMTNLSQNGPLSTNSTLLDPERIQVLPYRWGTDCSHLQPPCDVIFASDVVYQPSLAKDLIQSLCLLSHSNTIILLAYKARGLGEEVFFHRLKQRGFKWSIVPKGDHPREFVDSEYGLYHITKL